MVSSKHSKTLIAVFETPTRSNVRWGDIEKMIVAHGGRIEERSGSRVLIRFNTSRAVFHRPHPKPETDKGALVALRQFLSDAGLEP
ncbi:MAG: type II toxin-antitoxin system HicA family toxin [Rhodobacteraceae bacterium]|nr:type II toxin-antitoxin system HicA family toxin [Paracoccaceae bacterium]